MYFDPIKKETSQSAKCAKVSAGNTNITCELPADRIFQEIPAEPVANLPVCQRDGRRFKIRHMNNKALNRQQFRKPGSCHTLIVNLKSRFHFFHEFPVQTEIKRSK